MCANGLFDKVQRKRCCIALSRLLRTAVRLVQGFRTRHFGSLWCHVRCRCVAILSQLPCPPHCLGCNPLVANTEVGQAQEHAWASRIWLYASSLIMCISALGLSCSGMSLCLTWAVRCYEQSVKIVLLLLLCTKACRPHCMRMCWSTLLPVMPRAAASCALIFFTTEEVNAIAKVVCSSRWGYESFCHRSRRRLSSQREPTSLPRDLLSHELCVHPHPSCTAEEAVRRLPHQLLPHPDVRVS